MSNIITSKFDTASGDYPRTLELEFIQKNPNSAGNFGFLIEPDDIETRENWARFFRIHGQTDRVDYMAQRHQRGVAYVVPCRDPEAFDKWLRSSGAIKPKAERRKQYKNLPPMDGTPEEDREIIEKALRVAIQNPSYSRRISVPRAVQLGIELPTHIVHHWAFAIADDHFDQVDAMPHHYAEVDRVYPGVIDEAIEEAKKKRGIPVLGKEKRDALYKVMKRIAGRMGAGEVGTGAFSDAAE